MILNAPFISAEVYCYLYCDYGSRNISKEEIDNIDTDLSYHLLGSSNFFDIDEEELNKVLKVKSPCE